MLKSGQRILLVDDDADIVELLQYNLEKEGYEVRGVNDSTLVLDIIPSFQPHVIILDIMMPNLNGFELCQCIRSQEIGRDVTIFFMTSGSEKLSESAIQFGGDDFIQKLSGLRTLINRVNLVLKRKLVIRKREEKIKLGRWQVIKSDRLMMSDSHKIKLTELEFDLVYFLAQNPGRSIPIKYLSNVVEVNKTNTVRLTILKYLKQLQETLDRGLIEFTSEHRVRVNVNSLR